MTIVGQVGGSEGSEGAAAFSEGFGWSKYDFGQDKWMSVVPGGRRSRWARRQARRNATSENATFANGSVGGTIEGEEEAPEALDLEPQGCDPHFGNVLISALVTCVAVMVGVYCLRELCKVSVQMLTKAPEPSPDLSFPKWEGPVFLTQYFAVCDAIASSMSSFCDGWMAFASLALIFGPLLFVAVSTFLIFIDRVRGDLVFIPEEHQHPKEFWKEWRATPGLVAKAKSLKGYYDSRRSAGEWDEDTKSGQRWGWLITDFKGGLWFFYGILMCKAILINLAIGLTNGKENAAIALAIYLADASLLLILRPFVDNVANISEASTGITNAMAVFNAALPQIIQPSSGKPTLPAFVGDPMTIMLTTLGTGIATVKAIMDPFFRVIGLIVFVLLKLLDMCGIDREQAMMAAGTVGALAAETAQDKAKEIVTGGDEEEEEDEDEDQDNDEDGDEEDQEGDEEAGAHVDRAMWRRMSASSLTVVLDIAKSNTGSTPPEESVGGALPATSSRRGSCDSMVILSHPEGAGTGLRSMRWTRNGAQDLPPQKEMEAAAAVSPPEVQLPKHPEIDAERHDKIESEVDRSLPYKLRDILSSASNIGCEIHASLEMVFNPLLGKRAKERLPIQDPSIVDNVNIVARSRSPIEDHYVMDHANVVEQDRLPSPTTSSGSGSGTGTRLSSRLDFDDTPRVREAFVSLSEFPETRVFTFEQQRVPSLHGPIFRPVAREPSADVVYNRNASLFRGDTSTAASNSTTGGDGISRKTSG
eukprot:CAMPEP_0181294474 /NCGR_PEP_ID=MMETSP1101-20121128/3623_1 /TAXON_ID=46948 /ORGANISM="Rhodomonas abbreviata, Strain Caron Lab Isolate" /LENGTH=758 /DNA_ID=CAMNT_0023399141 /DNA_START=24 /DNA_END=2300 /DNA_ORIENTATION=-